MNLFCNLPKEQGVLLDIKRKVIMELNLDIEKYLSKFKVHHPKTLFPPDFSLLRKNLCPICGKKLYWNMKKDKAFCKSKVGDKFFITRNTASRLGGTLLLSQ